MNVNDNCGRTCLLVVVISPSSSRKSSGSSRYCDGACRRVEHRAGRVGRGVRSLKIGTVGIAELYADCHFFGSWIGGVVHANTVFAGEKGGILFVESSSRGCSVHDVLC